MKSFYFQNIAVSLKADIVRANDEKKLSLVLKCLNIPSTFFFLGSSTKRTKHKSHLLAPSATDWARIIYRRRLRPW